MRKARRSVIAALALTGAVTMALAGIAVAASVSNNGTDSSPSGVNQSVSAAVSKNSVIKKATKGVPATPVKLTVGVGVNTSAGTRPPASRQVNIQIGESDEFIFDDTGLGKCSKSQLENTNTEDAEDACKKALIGKGASEAECSETPSSRGVKFPGVVRAFNGGTKGKNRILLLHAYTILAGFPQTTVLEGTLNKKNDLSVPVEELGFGSCGISKFEAGIQATTKFKGEKYSYVAAACPDKSWDFEGRFQYYDNPYGVGELNPKTSLACKGK